MNVPGPKQIEIPRERLIYHSVYYIDARAVYGGSKFPVAVAVRNGFLFPERRGYLVGVEFCNYFGNFVVTHIGIINRRGSFVNGKSAKNKKMATRDKLLIEIDEGFVIKFMLKKGSFAPESRICGFSAENELNKITGVIKGR